MQYWPQWDCICAIPSAKDQYRYSAKKPHTDLSAWLEIRVEVTRNASLHFCLLIFFWPVAEGSLTGHWDHSTRAMPTMPPPPKKNPFHQLWSATGQNLLFISMALVYQGILWWVVVVVLPSPTFPCPPFLASKASGALKMSLLVSQGK